MTSISRDASYTAYGASMDIPTVSELSDSEKRFVLPPRYYHLASKIHIEVDYGPGVARVVMRGPLLRPVYDALSYQFPLRLLLVSEIEPGVYHGVHLPAATLTRSCSEHIQASSSRNGEKLAFREFWFGPNFDPVAKGFAPDPNAELWRS